MTIPTFSEYRKNFGTSLDISEFETILQKIHDAVGNDEDGLELFQELEEQSLRYARIRAEWYGMSTEEKTNIDGSRTACHDALIVKVNQLKRYLEKNGKDISWFSDLGDVAVDRGNRKRIGDFACYIAFVAGIMSR